MKLTFKQINSQVIHLLPKWQIQIDAKMFQQWKPTMKLFDAFEQANKYTEWLQSFEAIAKAKAGFSIDCQIILQTCWPIGSNMQVIKELIKLLSMTITEFNVLSQTIRK